MLEILGAVFDLIAALVTPRPSRARGTTAGPAPATLAGVLRALSRQLAPPQPAPPAAAKRPASSGAIPAPVPPVSVPESRGPVPAVVPPPAARPASAEAGLVAALFANPQTLVAAFIASEVLAKPVALRDS